jgi:chromosome segregation protein
MVDHFLVATQAERKEFFDEAAGVKEYQIKKNQTINQLERTQDNLKQTEITLNELGPRYRSLVRMVKRLEKREEVEKELREQQTKYYGALYYEITSQWQKHNEQNEAYSSQLAARSSEIKEIQKQLDSLEQENSGQEVFENLQKQFNDILDKKNQLREKQLQLQHKINIAKREAKQNFIPLSVDEMAQEIEELLGLHEELTGHVEAAKDLSHLEIIKEKIVKVVERLKGLLKKVKKPEDKEIEIDKELEQELGMANEELGGIDKELARIRQEIGDFNKKQEEKKGEFFDLQRQFSAKQNEINELSIKVNDVKIELAKLETKKEDLEAEIKREMGEMTLSSQLSARSEKELGEVYSEVQRLKHQLELIGGLDEESLKEFDEIKGRYEFLQEQYDDLIKAIESLEKILKELDEEIHARFDQTFKAINERFGEYFKKLFGGGRASLEKIMLEVEDESETQSAESGDEISMEAGSKKKKLGTQESELRTQQEYQYGGVEIVAVPPGKKISSLNTLSGGERAMTAIALICAIIASNPSPFVVLDEVDAALDESNSERFSAILEELSHHTQFIVVTHNRATMRRADVLYGVTMGDDSVSKMLSVKLEEGERWAK